MSRKLLMLAMLLICSCRESQPDPIRDTNQLSQSIIELDFSKEVIDSAASGDVKLVADVDGDGFKDLLVAGLGSDTLNWYHYPSWTKTVIATSNVEFTTDGAMGDVDGDGDQDIVVPDGPSGNNLVWFENPRPSGNPSNGGEWVRRTIGSIGNYGKDVELADFDGDGRLDVATRSATQLMVFFQDVAGWTKVPIAVSSLGNEGLASGDIDGDGDTDLVVRGAWLRNPGSTPMARATACVVWTEHVIGAADSDFKTLVAEINGQGGPEVLFSSSENTADVQWCAHAGGPTGTWTCNTIAANVERAHTLQAADFNQDGATDVVIGQMHTSAGKELALYLNDGAGASWTKQVIDSGSGLHNGVVADIGNDGFWDVFGSNFTGNPPLHLWRSDEVPDAGTDAGTDSGSDASSDAPPPPSNLIARWTCDEGSGSVVADSSGNDHNGTVQGSTWTTGQFGSACAFDGSGQHVALGDFSLAGNEITVMGWTYIEAFNASFDERFFSKATGQFANDHNVMISETDSNGNRLRFRLNTTNGQTTTLIANSTLVSDTWFHWAATFDGAQMCLFKDAASVGCTSKTGTITASSAASNLGRNPDGTNPMNGRLDDVRLYSEALSASEIAAAMSGQP